MLAVLGQRFFDGIGRSDAHKITIYGRERKKKFVHANAGILARWAAMIESAHGHASITNDTRDKSLTLATY